MGHFDPMGIFIACMLALAASPVLAVIYAARMNERLAVALDRVTDISRDNARLYRERHAIVGERDEARIRLDEARRIAERTTAAEQTPAKEQS